MLYVMWYPQFKTVVLTSMFISVLFLTGCGKQDDMTTDDQTTAPAMEQTVQPDTTSNTDTQSDADTNTTPAATTTTESTWTTSTTTTPTSNTDSTLSSTFQSYKTPAGEEEVKVTATVDAKGIVKKVDLAFVTNASMSKKYQGC